MTNYKKEWYCSSCDVYFTEQEAIIDFDTMYTPLFCPHCRSPLDHDSDKDVHDNNSSGLVSRVHDCDNRRG